MKRSCPSQLIQERLSSAIARKAKTSWEASDLDEPAAPEDERFEPAPAMEITSA